MVARLFQQFPGRPKQPAQHFARPWANTTEYGDVYWDLMRDVKARFDEEGINVPFPQRELHVPGPIEVKVSMDRHRSNGGEEREPLVTTRRASENR